MSFFERMQFAFAGCLLVVLCLALGAAAIVVFPLVIVLIILL